MPIIKVVTDEDLSNQFLQDVDLGVTINIDNRSIKSNNGVLSTNSNSIFLVAGETVSVGQLVYSVNNTIFLFNKNEKTLIDKVVGFTNNGGTSGTLIEVITNGGICTNMYGLSPNTKYFASTGGQITSAAPSTGIRQVVAVALTSTSIIVNIQDSILKAVVI